VAYHCLGTLEVGYKLTFPESKFQVDVPLPFSVIERHLSISQREEYDDWLKNVQSQYPTAHIYFLQATNVR
jgi:hypothetical protein